MESSPNKILYVITKSNWGGAQAYVYTLATHFAQNGAQVVVALGGTGGAHAPAGTLAEKLADSYIPTIFLKSFARDVSVAREFMAFFELLRVIRDERPNVLHLNSSKAGGLGAFAGRIARVPKIVFTSHGLAYDEDRSLFSRALIWLTTWVTFLLCHNVIVISEDNYQRARRLPFCKNKIRLIHNGIAPETLLDRTDARAKLLPHEPASNKVWIGTIAELTRNKDLPSLIRAASLLKRQAVHFVLCIIGEGEEHANLKKLIAEERVSDCVHLLGFVASAQTYLKAFDIFTLVSIKEGLPYVLLEAAQADCAIVATRIPGVVDIVDEHTGLLVMPKGIPEIATALEALLTDERTRKQLGTALHAKVSAQFSIEQMLKKVATLY